jgi:hypothetical protein
VLVEDACLAEQGIVLVPVHPVEHVEALLEVVLVGLSAGSAHPGSSPTS